MIYAAMRSDGEFTGATYPDRDPQAVAHHKRYGETLTPLRSLDAVVDTSGKTTFHAVRLDADGQRREALRQIDATHAAYLRELTGGATVEERDTWPRKLLAALAVHAGTASEADVSALTKGAAQRGLTIEVFAGVILEKDRTFAALIDEADALRDKGRAAIVTATADDMPLDVVSSQIAAVLTQLDQEASAAVAQFQSVA